MSFPAVQIVTVTVHVSVAGNDASFTYDPSAQIEVLPHTQCLILLVLDPASQAIFSEEPIIFIDPPEPPNITVMRDTDTLCTILDYNDDKPGEAESFKGLISVQIDCMTFTSPDPTIINLKPS